MMKFKAIFIACVVAFAAANTAAANDSSANQTSGGLILSKTDAVAMRSEELRISREKIEVCYEFQNVTDRDVTLTVAFPVPDIDPDFYNMQMDKTFVGEEFKTTVDGVPIIMKAERKALLDGKDITGKLAALGLPSDPQRVEEKLQKMPDDQVGELMAKLVDMGLMGYDMDRVKWTYQRRFFREQLFPAGKTVVVTHSYQPSVGSTLSIPTTDYGPDDKDSAKERARYCMDADFVRSVTAREKKGETFAALYINYILSSGANWAGGKIGSFRLVVDKGSPDNLVSFCGTGVRKISATQFEMVKKNFTPTRELDIAIFESSRNISPK